MTDPASAASSPHAKLEPHLHAIDHAHKPHTQTETETETDPSSPCLSVNRKGKGGRRAANPHLTEEQRRRERVLKNRESAMKSLQKKKRYTEHLEHRAVELATRNAELKDKIRTQLARLQAMGIVAVPGVGVFAQPASFQTSQLAPAPEHDCLPDFALPAPSTPTLSHQPDDFHLASALTASQHPISQPDPFVLDPDGRLPFDLHHMTCGQ